MKSFVGLLALPIIVAAGCSTSEKSPSPSVGAVLKASYTHVIAEETAYYLNGPQQAMPPQGRFPKGTKVTIVRDAGSYAVVTSENGITAHVATSALKKMEK